MKTVTVVVLILITFTIGQLIVIKYIMDNKDAIDANPLVVGANRYNINSCTCFIDIKTSIMFNKTSSVTITNQYLNKFGVSDESG